MFFIRYAFEPETQFFYFAWVLSVAISIVLHELAHGWMAVRLGDTTPIDEGRSTGNPLVHMGPFSLVALFLIGIAWGQMPINPGRLRGRYGEAKVAAAGPALNVLLALACLVALGLLLRLGVGGAEPEVWLVNVQHLLMIAGSANLVLALFNIMPVPPLDGSHILANFHRPYAEFISDPARQGLFLFGFIAVFLVVSIFRQPLRELAGGIVEFVRTIGA